MPRFTVILTRDLTESVSIEVEAKTPEDAEALALDMDTEEPERFQWGLDDNTAGTAYTNGADLIREEPEPVNQPPNPGDAVCQECLRPTTVIPGKRIFVQHGPGKDGALTCEGSGQRPTVRL